MKHFKTINEYCQGINIDPPRHPHFDIRCFEDTMKTVHQKMPPFRHEFYAIAIKEAGGGKAITGQFSDFPEGITLFFNTPFQVLSWDIDPNWKGYYLMFSQDFIAQSNILASILNLFPFLKIDKSVPLTITGKESGNTRAVFEKIWEEYHGVEADKFQVIEAEVYLLLTLVKRLFEKQVDKDIAQLSTKAADLKLLSRYQTLIQTSFYPEAKPDPASNLHSPSYYAKKLHVHPNHLNAIVKSVSGITALAHIHKFILALAKSYLAQTDWPVKEIAYTLHFDSPNNFSSFFKKNTGHTPLSYRAQAHL